MRKLTTGILLSLLVAVPRAQTFPTLGILEGTTMQGVTETTNSTINAAGESIGTIGYIWFADGATGNKTCSSGGGCKIALMTSNVLIWANVATNVRLGIQDVNLTTGVEDGSFDVEANLVPGTDTVSVSTTVLYTMESGTKTVTARTTPYAIVAEMTAVGGTDTVTLERIIRSVASSGFPYGTVDIGSGPVRTVQPSPFLIQFDDGTYGWIQQAAPLRNFNTGRTTATVNTGTTPDEIGLTCQFPVSTKLNGFGFWLSAIVAGDDFEYTIYENPYTSSPDIIWGPVAVDPDQLLSGGIIRVFEDELIVPANADIAFMFRPTTANSITYEYFALPSSTGVGPGMKKAQFCKNIKQAGRVDNTGAFAETAATSLPMFVLHTVNFIQTDYGNSFPALLVAP